MGGFGRTVRVGTAAALVLATSAVYVTVTSQVANAADWGGDGVPKSDLPSRLYMAPAGSIFDIQLPEGFPAFPTPIPAGELLFDSSTDLISQQKRAVRVTTEDDPDDGCDISAGTDWFTDGCTGVTLDVNHGLLYLGALTERSVSGVVEGFSLPGGSFWETLEANGDDYTADGGFPQIHLNGTEAQLNATLANLKYIPAADYHYDGSNPETLTLSMVSGDPALGAINDWFVDIRVLDWNDWPDLTPDDPGTVQADPSVELILQNADPSTDPYYDVTDEDNDELIDGQGEEDPDGNDGAEDEFLLIGWLDCGQAVAPQEGFHFGGASFDTLAGSLSELIDEWSDGNQELADQLNAALALVDAATGSSLSTLEWETSDEFQYTDAFAAIGDIVAVHDALRTLYFTHDKPEDSCDLLTIVSDLGNNGLPVQYIETVEQDPTAEPPTNAEGFEIPFFGFDWNVLTIETGALQEIEIDWQDPSSAVLEGDSSEPAIVISPAEHPQFDIRIETVEIPGSATSNGDYGSRLFQDFTVPADATLLSDVFPFTVDTNIFDDTDAEGPEQFQWVMTFPHDAPPGWDLPDDPAVHTVTILDDDDDPWAASIADVQGPEGDPGDTTTLDVEVSLTGPADGIEQLTLSTGGGTATGGADCTDPNTDYITLADEPVGFGPGDQLVIVPIELCPDIDAEADETIDVTLTPVANVDVDDGSAVAQIENDDVPPTVTVTAVTTSPTNDASVEFDVVFSKPVTDFDDMGDVDTSLSTVGGSLAAVIDDGGDADAATYGVTVTGMATPDGTVAIRVPAGSAEDVAGRANLVSNTASVEWDSMQPGVMITPGATQGSPTSTSPIVFDVVFDEPVTDFDDLADVDLTSSTAGGPPVVSQITDAGDADAATYTVVVTGMTTNGDVVATVPGGVAIDLAGNSNTVSPVDAVVAWVQPLTVTIDQAPGQADPTNTLPIVFRVVFSQTPTDFDDLADVTLSGTAGGPPMVSAITNAGDADPTTFDVEVTGMSTSGTVVADIEADVATAGSLANQASTSTDNSVTWDVTAPTVTINQAPGQADPTNTSPIVFRVVFSEEVSDFDDLSDVTITGTAGGPAMVSAITNAGDADPTTFEVEVTGMTTSGTVIADVEAGVATDVAGNQTSAATFTDHTVTWDATAPTVTIDQGSGQADPTSTSPIVFRVVFSEQVTDFDDLSDVTLSGTAGGPPVVSQITNAGDADPTTFDVEVTGMTTDGTVIADVGPGVAADLAGNVNSMATATDNMVLWVEPPLTVTVDQAPGQADPTMTSPIRFRVVFSEPVTDFDDLADVDLSASTAGGTLTAVISDAGDVDAATYIVSVSGMTFGGTVVVSVPPGAATNGVNLSAQSISNDNTVLWTTPPLTITVPADIVVTAAPGDPGAAVTYPAPTTNGGVPLVSVVCDHASGAVYPIGVTTVTCVATDADPGQQEEVTEAVVSDSFTITVLEPPDQSTTTTTTNPTTTTTTTQPAGPTTTTLGPGGGSPTPSIPPTGTSSGPWVAIAAILLVVGLVLASVRRSRQA